MKCIPRSMYQEKQGITRVSPLFQKSAGNVGGSKLQRSHTCVDAWLDCTMWACLRRNGKKTRMTHVLLYVSQHCTKDQRMQHDASLEFWEFISAQKRKQLYQSPVSSFWHFKFHRNMKRSLLHSRTMLPYLRVLQRRSQSSNYHTHFRSLETPHPFHNHQDDPTHFPNSRLTHPLPNYLINLRVYVTFTCLSPMPQHLFLFGKLRIYDKIYVIGLAWWWYGG